MNQIISWHRCADPEGGGGGGQGVRTPFEKSQKNIGFLGNIGSDPLKNLKATKPAFNVGPILVVFGSTYELKKVGHL